MLSRRLFCVLSLAAMFAVPVAGARAAEDTPVATVESFYEALLATMKQGKELGVQGRFEKLKPAVEAAFDLAGITQLSVGPSWGEMSADQKKELVAAFSYLTTANYAANFKDFSGQAFVVEETVEERGSSVFVKSEMTRPDNDDIPFDYRLRKTSKGWKIIDVIYDGSVSELATRRSDFAATLKQGGAPALIAKLKELGAKAMDEAS